MDTVRKMFKIIVFCANYDAEMGWAVPVQSLKILSVNGEDCPVF